ncbi:hypothetical protein [Promicromonospora iranensis]|uniref:Nitrogen fixation-related uncharacterized protein n=1 Tax=Promicromonospora iranensis TaxID=1105144 RepID=A0ABU2CQB2_9MICO|nr:hypothetical protein [Promicromonospora iranensis]MDR7383520.1 nitrogen fixation-related uncharacterized protein [Promicromonospora iranensis]
MQTSLIIVLIVAAAVLPIIGFGRLLWRIQSRLNEAKRTIERRGHSSTAYEDMLYDIREPLHAERRSLLWDIGFVGTGLVAGAVASIWSLFL